VPFCLSSDYRANRVKVIVYRVDNEIDLIVIGTSLGEPPELSYSRISLYTVNVSYRNKLLSNSWLRRHHQFWDPVPRGNEMTGERTALQKRGESEAFGPYVNRHFFVHIVFDFLVVDSTS
jgi:hypothetical protein